MNIPILLIAYKKEDTTRQVIEHFRKIRARQLYIVFNAPDPEKDTDPSKCNRTRQLVGLIDWDCNLQVLYRDVHLMVTPSYIDSVNWFFTQVEEGIILDDDCIPDESFYDFCGEMLEKYRHIPQVMHISGSNFLSKEIKIAQSYFFSKFPSCWGWATWRRAWHHANFDEIYKLSDEEYIWILKQVTSDKFIINQLYWHLNAHRNWNYRQADAPDWRWTFAIWYYKGVSITPSTHLIHNIGIGNQEGISTGKTAKEIDFASKSVSPILFPLQHPMDTTTISRLEVSLGKKYFPLSKFRRWRYRFSNFLGRAANGIKI